MSFKLYFRINLFSLIHFITELLIKGFIGLIPSKIMEDGFLETGICEDGKLQLAEKNKSIENHQIRLFD